MVSFPPLIDMLKFSGYPYLIRGQPGGESVAGGCHLEPPEREHYYAGSPTAPPLILRRAPDGTPNTKQSLRVDNDARTGMPPGIPEGAMCVQRFDDSLNSAIHITYRISLRSSSMPEPRDPLLKVLTIILVLRRHEDIRVWRSSGGRGPAGPAAETGLPKQQRYDRQRVGGLPCRERSTL